MNSSVRVIASRRYGTLSPLRYPGGKAALAGFFHDIIDHLSLRDVCYVEPYAGGAGAGIALLRQGIVDHLVINDIDPAVHAFWYSVMHHSDQLIDLVATVPLTIDQWRRQRAIYQAGDESDLLRLGFAFFYLNRTNRSGILPQWSPAFGAGKRPRRPHTPQRSPLPAMEPSFWSWEKVNLCG